MPDLAHKPLTVTQREKFLTLVADGVGTREALRRAGVTAGSSALAVTRADAKAIVAADPELQHDYLAARGRDPDAPEGVLFDVMLDTGNPRRLDAAKFWLERRHPDYATASKVELTGANGGAVQVEKREVSIVGVLAALARADALPPELVGSLGHLAGAGELLPAQPD